MTGTELHEGDCRTLLPTLPAASFDSIVTDPPYPCIDRPYGRWTEAEWFDLMDVVVPECRRVLKPTGSAVFVLQPNSERVGRMRTWLLEFTLKWAKAWGQVQDAYWWNTSTLPLGGACTAGLLRPSLKWCVWLGSPDCYRNQGAVLWSESDRNTAMRLVKRARQSSPSGLTVNKAVMCEAVARRGGVTPFNVIPTGGCNRWDNGGGAHGHGASTPMTVTRWWIRYLTPPGGRTLDPFAGSGTTLLAADAEGMDATGIEQNAGYCATIRKRLAEAAKGDGLFAA